MGVCHPVSGISQKLVYESTVNLPDAVMLGGAYDGT